VQVKPEAELAQEPPFSQGEEAQESNVVSHWVPKWPDVHVQVKPEAVLAQEPPFKQGEEAQESKVVSHCVPK